MAGERRSTPDDEPIELTAGGERFIEVDLGKGQSAHLSVGKFGDRFDEASRVFRAPVSGRYQLTWTQGRDGKWSLQAVLLDDGRLN